MNSQASSGPRYAEWRVAPEFRGRLACVWAAHFGAAGERHVERVIPDGCIDVVFSDGELTIAGPDTTSVELPALSNLRFVGVRFRAGIAPSALGVPASELLDRRVPARDVLGDRASRLCDELAAASNPRHAAALLERAAADWLRAGESDTLVTGAVSKLRAERADFTVASLASELGVSERQLRRRFVAAVGYGPKLLERIVRLRRFIRGASFRSEGLAALAHASGYADQPHLTRECRELTGLTPSELVGYPVTSG